MTLERDSLSGWRRAGATAVSWAAVVLLVESTAGVDIARGVQDGEQRIELRLRERWYPPPPGSVEPPRTDKECIEPWELVSV
jgi:hypothetical protein